MRSNRGNCCGTGLPSAGAVADVRIRDVRKQSAGEVSHCRSGDEASDGATAADCCQRMRGNFCLHRRKQAMPLLEQERRENDAAIPASRSPGVSPSARLMPGCRGCYPWLTFRDHVEECDITARKLKIVLGEDRSLTEAVAMPLVLPDGGIFSGWARDPAA